MFSYRHIYHAGNHADVFKHTVLTGLLLALQRKPSPYCVLDTHAGIGHYDFKSNQASKNAEFKEGIAKVVSQAKSAPELIKQYLSQVQLLNSPGSLRFYPGSPLLARQLSRDNDQLIACEFNRADHEILKGCFRGDSQVAVHCKDGFNGMKAFLPPKLKRGLVIIDPPYELKDEVEQVVGGLELALKRWPNGIYAIWYPILDRPLDKKLREKVKNLDITKLLDVQLTVKDKPDVLSMIGSGLLIINSPWQFDDELQQALPWLQKQLSQNGEGYVKIEHLIAE
ncbi:MAG: 23S rRNA (adenine(2030)-N(6))-methyltransferase RlmJ [Gammaproteobacteria bacterium]|nr:23S rRNA (adenine(2030)-N(6))-methyltransferase RlmJ [Gammaproteobacteria bacterium]